MTNGAARQGIWAKRADAAAVADHVAGVIARPGPSRLAVPGGQTPVPILAMLAARDLPWAGTEIVLTDDRIVPVDHPASNHGLLTRSLGGTQAHLRPLEPGLVLGRFDLVWLGMGADGHIASIFPNAMEELIHGKAVMRTRPDPLPAEAPFERLTLTMEMLANSAETIIVARGTEKRQLLENAAAGDDSLPIGRFLARQRGPVTFYWSEQ